MNCLCKTLKELPKLLEKKISEEGKNLPRELKWEKISKHARAMVEEAQKEADAIIAKAQKEKRQRREHVYWKVVPLLHGGKKETCVLLWAGRNLPMTPISGHSFTR